MRLVCHAEVCIKKTAESLILNTYDHLITFLLWAFKARKTLSIGYFLMEKKCSGQPLTEFWWHILSGCLVCDWCIQYHLCSTYRELWRLVVVQLSWLGGRTLAAAASSAIGLSCISLVPRRGGGGERAPGTHCLRMRVIIAKARAESGACTNMTIDDSRE